jgi:hypothetical protein
MNKFKTEIKWALVFSAMTLLWMLLERVSGLHSIHIDKHPIYTNLVALPAIATYVFALRDKKKNDYAGKMTYKQGFISGCILSLVITILTPLTEIITLHVITPEFFANAIKYAVASGHSTQQEAEKYFNTGNYIVQGLIGAPVMGLITSAIVAIFTRSGHQSS